MRFESPTTQRLISFLADHLNHLCVLVDHVVQHQVIQAGLEHGVAVTVRSALVGHRGFPVKIIAIFTHSVQLAEELPVVDALTGVVEHSPLGSAQLRAEAASGKVARVEETGPRLQEVGEGGVGRGEPLEPELVLVLNRFGAHQRHHCQYHHSN